MIFALFALPIVRHIAAGVLVVAAIGAIGLGIYHSGRRAGLEAEAGSTAEVNHLQVKQLTETFQAQLAAGQAREARLEVMATQFAQIAATARAQVVTVQAASAADAGKVRALPDSAVKADLETKAGGPLENLFVLRHIDDVITDYPHKLDELKATNEELSATASRQATNEAQLVNVAGERDSAIAAFNGLLPFYMQAYNAAIRGHRKWYCLFLCKPKKIAGLPDPISLAGSVKKK